MGFCTYSLLYQKDIYLKETPINIMDHTEWLNCVLSKEAERILDQTYCDSLNASCLVIFQFFQHLMHCVTTAHPVKYACLITRVAFPSNLKSPWHTTLYFSQLISLSCSYNLSSFNVSRNSPTNSCKVNVCTQINLKILQIECLNDNICDRWEISVAHTHAVSRSMRKKLLIK